MLTALVLAAALNSASPATVPTYEVASAPEIHSVATGDGNTGYEGQPGNQSGNTGSNGSTGGGNTGYEGQPGNQSGGGSQGGGSGNTGYEGQPGNQSNS